MFIQELMEMSNMSKKQTILITGATAGIGRAAAIYLAERGHRVIASGRREHALVALEAEAPIETLRLDVTDDASIAAAKRTIDALTDGHGIDVLINNAGYGFAAPLAEASDADLRKQFDTNVFGLMAVTRAFLPQMIKRRSGRVINVSSIGGRITFPMMGAYHASKYALEALSDALRMELAAYGVHVSLIEPGPIQTEFVERMNEKADPYKHEGSLYANIYQRAARIEKRFMSFAPGPLPISKAIHRAVTARRPKARYVAPFSNVFMLAFLRLLPTRLRDSLCRAVFGLNTKQLQPPPAARLPQAA